jgi:hypothetical protein
MFLSSQREPNPAQLHVSIVVVDIAKEKSNTSLPWHEIKQASWNNLRQRLSNYLRQFRLDLLMTVGRMCSIYTFNQDKSHAHHFGSEPNKKQPGPVCLLMRYIAAPQDRLFSSFTQLYTILKKRKKVVGANQPCGELLDVALTYSLTNSPCGLLLYWALD